jgi:predicted transposase YdaD
MNVVSDQGERISPWNAGLKVYYVNTVGLTNKNINEYLQLLLDKTTFNKKYKVTSKTKKEYYEKGGQKMSKELRQMMDEERAAGWKEGKKEGMIEAFISMVKEGLMNIKDAAKRLGMSEKELTKLAGLY